MKGPVRDPAEPAAPDCGGGNRRVVARPGPVNYYSDGSAAPGSSPAHGPTALALAGKFRPTGCVLDIMMPKMDGYELARRLRELPTPSYGDAPDTPADCLSVWGSVVPHGEGPAARVHCTLRSPVGVRPCRRSSSTTPS